MIILTVVFSARAQKKKKKKVNFELDFPGILFKLEL